ncbi:MAG: Cytochrome c-type biogenesis protein CcmE [Alphaproteobacteria bacterium MarineAlpha2_Bin1]|nr:MAG: Cytochrome c-type biogenesis protein CcmE [Alphaproteobacteria bacterium MarineAlpha2_Bin1]|tara:strand:+ start:388 stop:837 length:450 start_codon:yes stop_codon:yes gene_type:complete
MLRNLKPKRRRLLFLLSGIFILGISLGLALLALNEQVDLFLTPTSLSKKTIEVNKRFKLGGLVKKNSIRRLEDGITTLFIITDNNMSIAAEFKGVLPNLFREGQGVVAEGKLNPQKIFIASKIFAKHDENYLPPEIADAIKKEGQWKGE